MATAKQTRKAAPAAPVAAAGFVTVACRLPQGLIIELPDGSELKLHGTASAFAVAGHGMTQVKEDVWAFVQTMHADAKWLTSGAVFAMENPGEAAAKAKERKDVDAGFDPIDPSDPNAGLPSSVKIQKDGEDDPGMGR